MSDIIEKEAPADNAFYILSQLSNEIQLLGNEVQEHQDINDMLYPAIEATVKAWKNKENIDPLMDYLTKIFEQVHHEN